MDSVLQAFDETRDLRGKPFKSLCYAPDVQLSFSPNGDVSACCISRSHVLGNVRNDRLDDIWNGERIQNFRSLLRRNFFPPGCESCQWSLEAGNHVDHPIKYFDGLPVAERSRWPAKLEFALNNTCNLGCIMCSGEYSSVLRAKEGLPPLKSAYGEQFFADLDRYLPHTKTLSFLGGEPFIQKECYRIWDLLIEMQHAVPCDVTTNGSIFNGRVERVLEHLPFNIAVSVDGVTKETVESIRVNVKYETLMENIRLFNGYAQGDSDRHAALRGHHLQLNFCLMRQNWHEAADFFLFAEERGCIVWKVLVTYPPSCSLFTLDQDELKRIVDSLDARSEEIGDRLKLNRDVWVAMVEEVRSHVEQQPSEFDNVVRAQTGNFSSASQSTKSNLHRAWDLKVEGRLEEALRETEKTSDHDPDYYQAKCLRGEIKIDMGDLESAEQELQDALAITKKRPEAHLIRAWLRVTTGNMEAALAAGSEAAGATGHLREVEANIIEDIFVRRLTRYEALAAVLTGKFSRHETGVF